MLDIQRLQTESAALGFPLPDEAARRLAQYCAAMLETNRRLNLTAITEPRDIEIRHLLDCLAICGLPEFTGRVADVGTGAGFPGVVLAATRPDLALMLMDATAKKLNFVANACAACGISVATLHGRAEELAHGEWRESFDTVTARAVAGLPALLEYCLPLVRVGGYCVAMKGPEAEVELNAAANAISLLGGRFARFVRYELPGGLTRAAIMIEKISQTPAKYPRSGKNITKSSL